MSKTIKNLLIVLTLVCVVVLVVFIIELIVINSGNGDSSASGPTPSASTTGEPEDSTEAPPASPTGSGTIGTGPGGNAGQQTEPPRQPPTGRRYELLYSPTERLVVYADEGLFEHAELHDGDMFSYTGGGDAALLIHFESLQQGAERRAETFLDLYLDGNESHVSGQSPIKRSSLSGVLVIGVKGNETFEAWIHSIPDGDSDASNDIGIAFVIHYSNDEQKNALYTVLDSLELTRA